MLNKGLPPVLTVQAGVGPMFVDAASSYRIQCIAANMTSDTIRGKEDSLAYFGEFLSERGIVRLEDVSTDVCRDYIGLRWEKGNSPATVLHHHRILKAAFAWLSAEY